MSEVGPGADVAEVAENVYRLRLPMPFELKHINVYLLREGNRLALVDCGLDDAPSQESLQAGFAALGLNPADLTDIFVTHAHPDHIGQLQRLRQLAPQARLYMHQWEYNRLAERAADLDKSSQVMQEWLDRQGESGLEGARLARMGLDLRPHLQPDDILLEGGETIRLDESLPRGWRIMWTPGHTAGHFVLYQPERGLLLSGDHLLTDISSNIGKYPGSTDDPLGDFLNSLAAIRTLDIKTVLPAHGLPFNSYRERIDYLTEHHRSRLAKIYATLENGPRTNAQIVEAIWGQRAVGFHRYLALVEALSHLERLQREGQIQAETSDGVIFYRAA